ncbi:DUF3140 domain-containing protein [Caballeronia terrestris]|uniref:DUF3140 domain-containing protein n=1 Tax=Caballeronia terrestris TaxID=1226301 RepID=UPI000B3E4B35
MRRRPKDRRERVDGHRSGRRIVEVLATKKAELTAGDHAHMQKVAGYTERHSAQRPHDDIEHTASAACRRDVVLPDARASCDEGESYAMGGCFTQSAVAAA